MTQLLDRKIGSVWNELGRTEKADLIACCGKRLEFGPNIATLPFEFIWRLCVDCRPTIYKAVRRQEDRNARIRNR